MRFSSLPPPHVAIKPLSPSRLYSHAQRLIPVALPRMPLSFSFTVESVMPLKQQLTDDMKAAMKSGDKHSLGVIRLINAAIKQREVDERVDMDDAAVIAVMDKMVKQRKDSVSQYEAAGREDLATVEREEIAVIARYLPAKLGQAEIVAAIQAAIAQTGASGPADIGKLMGALKPMLAGKADMGQVSALVKQQLGG
ncbi:hypothetical protein XALC_0415 [Xanthomonas albilineans GPE PC73]|uniref:Uncharacterized protein n=2 Tax=Xanthomonas albilineans TaxID=29447 RepID=D2UB44_XANAP|nr:hypothetical protein XALC_0415 [Xanthomonas albilineans GPE PC73]